MVPPGSIIIYFVVKIELWIVMFFGRDGGSEDVAVERLPPLLQESFDRKVRDLESKAARLVKGIESSRRSFLYACEEFERLAIEPDIEYRYVTSTTYVKDLKNSYITALKRIVNAGEIKIDGETTYQRYSTGLASAQETINEILRTNKTFKLVLDAYANHLDKFKRSFSNMEAYAAELKSEMQLKSTELNQYESLLAQIERLLALMDELVIVKKEAEELANAPKQEVARSPEERDILYKSINRKRTELESVKGSIQKINSEMSVLLGSIDKAARKHDHISLSKVKLAQYIHDQRLIFLEYSDFIAQARELSKEIAGENVSLKNRDEVSRSLDSIVNGRIKEMVDRIQELDAARVAMEAEVRDLERVERELSNADLNAQHRTAAIARLRERTEKMLQEEQDTKATIERLFIEYYRKRIQITV